MIGSLLAILALSRGGAGGVFGDGHAHADHRGDHRGGMVHRHFHVHDDPVESPRPGDQGSAESIACSPEVNDHGDCCHGHHHDYCVKAVAVTAREREYQPIPVVMVSASDAQALWAMPHLHRCLRPHARGRPPDHLIYIRTVVLLT
jgi:hypothetical protein